MRRVLLPVLASALLAPAVVRAQSADDKLTAEGLPKFLRDLGYEPEKVGETSQRVVIERDKFTFRLNLSVSGNTKKVWMSSYLVQFDDPAKIPASVLADALLANGDTGPAHFYLVKVQDKYWLKMGFALDNRGVTPAYFRGELDWFLERLAEKAAVWDKTKWVKGG